MAVYDDREHFIPLRKSELIDLLCAEKRLPAEDADQFRQFCRLLSALYHFEYNQKLEELKSSYAPFDPDADTTSALPLSAAKKQGRLNELFSDFGWLLDQAHFKHLSRGEIDPAPLMRRLAAEGARLALPVITARGQGLRFRSWLPDDRLLRGALGILEPSPGAAEITPDVLLVPLAAFDKAGHRIGYGAGHYDRTLAQLRKARSITAIGLAFGAQQVEAVPALQHDVALDFVLTDTQVFDFRSSSSAHSFRR